MNVYRLAASLTALQEKLTNSRYGSNDEVEAMASAFDKVTKCTFNGPEAPYYVKFGGFRDSDARYDIRSGSIKIPGYVVNEPFRFLDPISVLLGHR